MILLNVPGPICTRRPSETWVSASASVQSRPLVFDDRIAELHAGLLLYSA